MLHPNQPSLRMRYSLESRCRAVQAIVAGAPTGTVARRYGVSRATVYRWWRRFRADGWAGLSDRPSTPHRQPRRFPPALEACIVAAREASGDGALTLAAKVGTGRLLRRQGAAPVWVSAAAARAACVRDPVRT